MQDVTSPRAGHWHVETDVDSARQFEADRIEQIIQSVWAACLEGDKESRKVALDAIKQKCDLYGLAAPKSLKSEISFRKRNELPLPFDLAVVSAEDLEILQGLINKYTSKETK